MAIANELRQLIDYHNCRIFVRDGDELAPIAFQGELTAPDRSASRGLPHPRRRGLHRPRRRDGRAAPRSRTRRSASSRSTIEGTTQIDESIIAVPLNYGARVIGAIVVSKLGLDQFDEDDLRLLEVLAGHAAVALENASLYEAQRREAESAKALLEFGRELAAAEGLDHVLTRVVEGAAQLIGAPHASLWLQDASRGDLVGQAAVGYEDGARDRRSALRRPTPSRPFVERTEPYTISPEQYAAFSDPPAGGSGSYMIAPFIGRGPLGRDRRRRSRRTSTFGDRELELVGGLAHQAKLAIANASSFAGLERTFLSTVEALANALEASDEYTSSHARWITDTALRVGQELGARRATR